MIDNEIEDMQWRDYRAMLQTRHQAATELGMKGFDPWPPHKAARLMAIVQVFGNNEGFTLSPKFKIDREYIQDLYRIKGGAVPDPVFAEHLRYWVHQYECVGGENDRVFIDARDWIMQMYNFKLLC